MSGPRSVSEEKKRIAYEIECCYRQRRRQLRGEANELLDRLNEISVNSVNGAIRFMETRPVWPNEVAEARRMFESGDVEGARQVILSVLKGNYDQQ